MTYQLLTGDCREVLAGLPADSVDAVVCDPPYHIAFMGRAWDSARAGVAFDPATWAAVLRVTKPGAYLLAAGSPRTYHRLACAIEDGGWTLIDTIMHIHSQGFPKGKGQLKPAYEPWTLARKPAARVLPLQIDAARLPTSDDLNGGAYSGTLRHRAEYRTTDDGPDAVPLSRLNRGAGEYRPPAGRWPPNLAFSHAPGCRLVGQQRVRSHPPGSAGHRERGSSGFGLTESAIGYADADGFETVDAWECDDDCAVAELDRQSGERPSGGKAAGVYARSGRSGGIMGQVVARNAVQSYAADTGGASRFFPTFQYCAKAPTIERTLPDGGRVSHPTQKPLTLMRWLVRLVAAPGMTCLDPFAGSGTTGVACLEEGVHFIGIEQDAQYAAEACQRIAAAQPLLVPA